MTIPGVDLNAVGDGPNDARAQEGRRRRAEHEQQVLSQLVGVPADPTYVVGEENFASWPHEALYAEAQKVSPGDANMLIQSWQASGAAVEDAFTALHDKISTIIGNGWHSAAADAAMGCVHEFFTAGQDTAAVTEVAALRMQAATDVALVVKAAMPEPKTPLALTPVAVALAGPAAMAVQQAAREEARQEAVRLMQGTFQPTYIASGQQVPGFVAPALPGSNGNSSEGPTISSTGGNSSPVGAAVAGTFGNRDSVPGAADNTDGSGGKGSEADSSAVSGKNLGGQGFPQSAGVPSSGLPSSAGWGQAEDVRSAAAASGAPGASYAQSAGAGNLSSGPHLGSGLGSGSGTGSGLNGAGGPAAAVGAGPSSGAGAGARTAGMGASGMPGMGAPGARGGNRDEEQEHKTPDYLIDVRNGEELLGTLPRAIVPVIGVWETQDPDKK